MMIATVGLALTAVVGIPATALAGDPLRCTTREDRQMKRLITTSAEGARAITKYDEQFKTWRTNIIRAPRGDKSPRGWLTLVNVLR
jgi:hypothetical protein